MSQTFDEIFSQTALHLLSGSMIDKVTEPAMMNWLEEEDNLMCMQDYLSKLNRQVLMTSDKAGAYLGYINIHEKNSNKAIRQSFSKMSVLLYPLILWLRLLRGATDSSRPLQTGDIIKLSDLLSSIESSKQLELQLADIIAKIGRNTKEAKRQLFSLVDYLETEGYLHSIGSTGALYKATAKWSLLYDQLEYIGRYQHLSPHEDESSNSHQSNHQNRFDLAAATVDTDMDNAEKKEPTGTDKSTEDPHGEH